VILCKFLHGENVAPLNAAKARQLKGHRIEYLRRGDIDWSGRGYFFPRFGLVIGYMERNLEIDDPHNYYSFGSFVEVVDKGIATP